MIQNRTSKNSNLFSQLYSTSQRVAQSGYKCSSAIDESDTSFDISNNEGEITDSNGDILASIDLSDIHADDISEYYSETKIVGSQSAYLLQGNVTGDTYAAYFFKMADEIQAVEDYEPYINIKFDIHWTACGQITAETIDTYAVRTEACSVCDIIQAELDKRNIPVAVSIQSLEMCAYCRMQICAKCSKLSDYLVFQSQTEGFPFYVHNVFVSAVTTDYENANGSWQDYTDSPFTGADIDFDYIINLIKKKAPHFIGECGDHDYTEVPCDIYKYMISIAPLAITDKEAFNYNYTGLREYAKCFNDVGELINERKFMTLSTMYPDLYAYYFGIEMGILNKYNIHDVLDMLTEVSTYVHTSNISGPYRLEEDTLRRLNPLKYPNGALRGIVIIPDYPSDSEDEYLPIQIAHVSDSVMIDENVELDKSLTVTGFHCNNCVEIYKKVQATVKINTLLQSEYEIYNQNLCNMPLSKVVSNESLSQTSDSLWTQKAHSQLSKKNEWCREMGYHTNDMWCRSSGYHDVNLTGEPKPSDYELNPGRPEHDIYLIKHDYVNEYNVPHKYDELGHIPGKSADMEDDNKENVIGLYRYMQYLNENKLWVKIGEAYIVIGKKDDYQSNDRNLLNSVLIYNPNKLPIRMKTLVFS